MAGTRLDPNLVEQKVENTIRSSREDHQPQKVTAVSQHDLIVVGAGTTGAHLAQRVAKLGLNVLLLERLPHNRVGDKVCGEGIALHHLKNAEIPYPTGKELGAAVNGIDIYPPSMQNFVSISQRVPGEPCDGWTINRLLFGQRLLKYAADAGVEIRDNAQVMEPVLENGAVAGVRYRDAKSKKLHTVMAPVTADTSGMSATLRRSLKHPLVENAIELRDQAVCYREILQLQQPPDHPDRCVIIMDDRYAPGGYIWIFPKGGTIVNAGIGTQGGQGHHPKELYQRFLASKPMFKGAKLLTGGGGTAPIRRPLWSYVANGILFLGDTACHVNPIHGGGIGPGLEAADVAAPVVKAAVEAGETTATGLWPFNVAYNRDHYGQKIASLDLMRRLLQDVGNEEFEYVINNRIITTDDLLRANAGQGLQLSATDKAGRFIRGLGKLGLLRRIQKVSTAMASMLELYRGFPSSPAEFNAWKTQVERIYASLGCKP
jgi:digeranylgeranylglycerophospholipid reductase